MTWHSNLCRWHLSSDSERNPTMGKLINIFVYGDENNVHSVGYRLYQRGGSYEEQAEFLRVKAQHGPSYRLAQ